MQYIKVFLCVLIFSNVIYAQEKVIPNDSLQRAKIKSLVKQSYKENDSVNFRKYIQQLIDELNNEKPSRDLAKAQEYLSAFYKRYHIIDSTFYYSYKSYKTYEQIFDSLSAGKMMMNIAILQKNIHDYTGSEISSLKALDFLKNTGNKRRIASVYNNLGIIHNNLKNYDQALDFHNQALELRSELKEKPIYHIQSLNNIGKLYKDQRNYKQARKYFTQALLNDSILENRNLTKSALIDNLAHTNFKMNNRSSVLDKLLQAKDIRENINDEHGLIMSYLHLAEFHHINNNKSQAQQYLSKAEKLAESTKKYREYLTALEYSGALLNGNKVKDKFKKYIIIRDSLDLVNKNYKEEFLHIKYDLEKKDNIIKAEQLRNRNKYYIIIFLLLIVITLLIAYSIIDEKRKQQQLEFQTLITSLQSSRRDIFNNPSTDIDNKNNFHKRIKLKFDLTDSLIEFWELQAQGFSENKIAEQLVFVKVGAIRKRRTKLYRKLKDYFNNLDEIDKLTSVTIYRDELEKFKKELK